VSGCLVTIYDHSTSIRDEGSGRGQGRYLFEIPLEVREVFSQARPPDRVTINDYTYWSTVAVYGGHYFLPLNACGTS